MIIRKFTYFLFLLTLSSSALAQDIQVTSVFDKSTASVGQEINLKIKVVGASGNVQAPRLPGYEGFDTFYTGRASHMTFVNGKSSSSIEFSYVLVPKQAGQFSLAPIEMTVNGRRFRTEPTQIEVTQSSSSSSGVGQSGSSPYRSPQPTSSQGNTNASYQAPPATFNPADDNIFVKAWVDKTSVYPNEQILLTYSLYTRYDTRYEGFEEEPQVSGFWIEEFPAEREIKRETVRLNGKRYVRADIKKVALFPTAAADYTIQPGTIKVSIRQEAQQSSVFDEFFNDSFFSGGNFFARRENRLIKPPTIALTVKPYPEAGKPISFQGATGSFRLQSSIDKREVKQNEPVTLKIEIEGEGNIETLEKPFIPELEQFKIYESDSSSQLYKTGNVIGGRKTFEIIFIPTESGNLEIPSMPFTFFNPLSARYQTLSTPVYPLNVEKSEEEFKVPTSVSTEESLKKEVTLEGKDIRYIWERSPQIKLRSVLDALFLGFAAADGFLILLIVLMLLRARQERIFAKDSGLKRKRFAKSEASARLKPLQKLLKSKDPEDSKKYFDEVAKTLTKYLSDKFNLSAHGSTRTDLERHLEQTLGREDKLYQEITEVYQMCDASRFGMATVSQDSKEQAMKILKDAISRVEKIR